MHLQVRVLEVQRQAEPLALNRIGERCSDVEVERVAEFVGSRSPAGFDAGGKITRVVPSEARFAERAEQVAQSFESEKVKALIGDFEFRLLPALSGLPAN